MVEDLCFHLVDLVQNSVAASSATITVTIRAEEKKGMLTLEVRDDGRGMDAQTLSKAQDPFFTSKSFKKVGLGLPLLQATTQLCRGDFHLSSEPGQGTRVRAAMERNHVDCPPLGDLTGTILQLLVSLDEINFVFEFTCPEGRFFISSAEVREQAGGLHLSHPEVYAFLQEYIHTHLDPLFKQ